MKTKNSNAVKMVMVAGMLVREDQVEGRLKCLREARERKARYDAVEAERLAKEKAELLGQGYSEVDINLMRRKNRIQTLENSGYGTSHSCAIGSAKREPVFKSSRMHFVAGL